MANDDTDKQTSEAGGEAKKNWRERLGINKDLPKIAAEFREEHRTPPVRQASGTTRVADRPRVSDAISEQPRTGQPVARPAPMAPRPSSVKPPLPSRPELSDEQGEVATSNEPETAANEPKPAANEPRPAPREPDIDDFSARLRAQREAAERLAQQRLAASRQAGAAAVPLVPDDGPEKEDAGGEPDVALKPSPAITRDEPAAPPPKFTFAPAELDQDEAADVDLQREPEPRPAAPAPQEPVRREPPPLRAEPTAPAGVQPQAERPQMQPTAAGLATPPLRNSVAPDYQSDGRRGVADSGQGNMPPLRTTPQASPPQPAPAAAPPPPRQPSWASPRAEGQAPPLRSPRAPSFDDDDLEDVFEDPARNRASQARARIDDYNAAYRDFDEGLEDDEDERRSSSGPIILILALLTVAAIAGALVYFYRANTPQTAGDPENVPVITAPDEPVKTEPDQAAQPAQPAEPVGRKQIYDRILGEETLEPETVVPSEEVPQVPSVDQVPAVDGSSEGEVEPLPLPLPPPPGTGDQGSLQTPASGQTTDSATVSPAGVTGSTARSDQQTVPTASDSTSLAAIPPPEPLAEAAGTAAKAATTSVPAAASEVTSATQSALQQAAQTVTSRATPPKPRVKPRQRVAAVTQTQPAPAPAPQPGPSTPSNDSGPVALTPNETAPAGSDSQSSFSLPNLLQNAGSGSTTRRTGGRAGDDDPLAGLRAPINSGGTATSQGAQQFTALQPQEVEPAPEPVPQPAPALQPAQPASQPAQPAPSLVAPSQPSTGTQTASTGTGYVVQLASYRSQAEAQSEYQRLKARHGGLLGNLPPSIQKAELGAAGTYYRLGVGPLSTKQSASNLCNSLIAAGEKDCLVRRQ